MKQSHESDEGPRPRAVRHESSPRVPGRKRIPSPSGFEAKERLREALAMDGLADADTIHVETDGTEIVLTGTVRSFAEVNQACHAAWSVPA